MKAIQHVDVVISTVGFAQIRNQINIISAIKESGKHIKVCPNYFTIHFFLFSFLEMFFC